jgi:uncharacterized protein YbjT (DUF2867 family)
MSSKKIIAVVGSTGAQGGGLVRAIMSDPNGGFTARAITRDSKSAKARELAALGAEVITADIDDEARMQEALEGAYGAFFVTFFWAHFSPEKEQSEAQIMAAAAKATGIKHAIWSTIEDTREWVPLSDDRMPTLLGKYKVPHFDGKGEANKFFIEAGVPTTFLYTSFFWENFIYFGMGPKKDVHGRLVLALPLGEEKFPGIAAEDIGKCAYGIFKQGQKHVGKRLGIAGDQLTGRELAATLSKALGQSVRYNAVTPAAYRGFGFPGADDLANMFQFNTEFDEDFLGMRPLDQTRALNPSLQTFEQWLVENKAMIPLE